MTYIQHPQLNKLRLLQIYTQLTQKLSRWAKDGKAVERETGHCGREGEHSKAGCCLQKFVVKVVKGRLKGRANSTLPSHWIDRCLDTCSTGE